MLDIILQSNPLYLALLISIILSLIFVPVVLYKRNKDKTAEKILSNEYSLASSIDLNQYDSKQSLNENTLTTQDFSSILSPNFDKDFLSLSHALTFDGANDRERALQVLELVIKQETNEKEKLRLIVIAKNYAKSKTKLIDLFNKFPSFKKGETEDTTSESTSFLEQSLEINNTPIKNEVWVNWMTMNGGKVNMKSSFIEINQKWGSKTSMEELQNKLSEIIGKDERGQNKQFSIISVHEISK